MTDFKLSDLSRVHWPSTLKLAAGRAFFTGVVIVVLQIFMAASSPASASMGSAIGMMLAMPFIWAIIGPVLCLGMSMVGRVAGFISDMIGGAPGELVGFVGGIIMISASLLTCLGDPIVYFINRSKPALFNVADLKFFNFRPLIFITYPD